MRYAVACNGLVIASRFVECTSYMCYTVRRGLVVSGHNIPVPDGSLENLPSFFREIDIDAIVVGAIDEGVCAMLESHGFMVIAGQSGDPLTAVRSHVGHISRAE